MSKKGIVRGKISFVICIQLIAILLFTGMTFVNHLMFKGAGNNGGTDASLTLIAGYFLLYSIFNAAFIPGYYKAPHKFGKQFLKALIAVFAFLFAFEGVMIASGAVEESVPVLGFIKTNLDAFPASPSALTVQLIMLAVCIGVYAATNVLVCRRAEKNFDELDI